MINKFFDRILKDRNDCWIWPGSGPNGYGIIYDRVAKKQKLVHRWSYETFCGEIGSLCVLHKCDIRNCANPDHLFLGTHKDNAQDAISKGRFPDIGALHRKKKACPHGHPYSVRNTYYKPVKNRIYRICRTCLNKQHLKRYYKNKEHHNE